MNLTYTNVYAGTGQIEPSIDQMKAPVAASSRTGSKRAFRARMQVGAILPSSD